VRTSQKKKEKKEKAREGGKKKENKRKYIQIQRSGSPRPPSGSRISRWTHLSLLRSRLRFITRTGYR
jgi:hypothetical protein